MIFCDVQFYVTLIWGVPCQTGENARAWENRFLWYRNLQPFSIFWASRLSDPPHLSGVAPPWNNVAVLQIKTTKRATVGVNSKREKVFVYVDKQGFVIKTTYQQTHLVNVQLQRGDQGLTSVLDLATTVLPQKYPKPVTFDVKKLQDIQVLLTFIPPHHKPFMVDLIAEQQPWLTQPMLMTMTR